MSDRMYNLSVWLQDFPPRLDTKTDAADLRDGFTPAARNLDLDADQRLAVGSIPAGTTRTAKTVDSIPDADGGSNTYFWHYNRLWRIDGNKLYWGAPGYDDYYYPVGRKYREFSETATPILLVLPFGNFQMAVFKSDVTYVLSNIQDTRDLTFKTDVYQEISIADASHAVELDGVVYASTSSGLKAFTGAGVKDLTRLNRDAASTFSGKALTADYNKKWIIGASSFVYDVERDGVFDYSASGFLYTSPKLRTSTYSPFCVDAMLFAVEHTDTNDAEFTYQVLLDDGTWGESTVVDLPYETEQYTQKLVYMPDPLNSRTFQFRITAMDTNIRIRNVSVEVSNAAQYELVI